MKIDYNFLIEIHNEMLALFFKKGYSQNEINSMKMRYEELMACIKETDDISQIQEQIITAMYEKYIKCQKALDKISTTNNLHEEQIIEKQPIGLQKREIELNPEYTRTFVESIFTRISNEKKLDKPKIETINADSDMSLVSYHDDDSDEEIQQTLLNL